MFKELEDLEDEDEELEDEEAEERAHADESMKCPKCQQPTNKTELVHPVLLGFNASSNIMVFFHDACYKGCSSQEVDRLVRDVKYELLLTSVDDSTIYHC